MIVMSFLLNAYWAKSRRSQPVGCGLPCPPELEKLLATNSRCVVPSVTDGNCALHAFAISLVGEASRNKALSATNVYKQLLPVEWVIGADNTAKETNNKWMCWSLIWLLCVLSETVLWSVMLTFLLVGHTHDMVDRLLSRVNVGLRGRNDSAGKQKIIVNNHK